MKARYIILIIVVIVLLAAVGIFIYERAHVPFHSDENGTSVSIIGGADGPTSVFIAGKLGGEDTMTYKQISMDEAKQIFESDADGSYIILDVRRADEFARGHIPGAINVANESIGAEAPAELIKGSICGVKIEEIEDPLMKQIRYLDKLVDELARGKAVEKIKRG